MTYLVLRSDRSAGSYGRNFCSVKKGELSLDAPKVAERITDYYLEKRLGSEIRQRYFGKKEEDYRRHCHEHNGENWLNVVKSIEERHPDFMKYSEEKSKKIFFYLKQKQ